MPARWLYDRRGSELFDEITRLPSYYPTRTETALLKQILPEVAERVPAGTAVVEFGAGIGDQDALLLEAVRPAAYVPVDISGDYLRESAAEVDARFPSITVEPVVADFARPFELPDEHRGACPSSASSPARPSAISFRAPRPICCAASATCSATARNC